MANCLIIGGGLAGLSSAIHSSKSGHKVELIEASPKLGGRVYSFLDKNTNTEIDNGQHILMGAYKNTFEYLEIIGSENIPFYQSNLDVNFVKRGGKKFDLKAPNWIYPINLTRAILSFNALNFSEKFSVLKFIATIDFGLKNKISLSVIDWMLQKKQSSNTIKSLWEVIGIGALNTKLNEASAGVFQSLMQKIFFRGNKSSTIVLPVVPLSSLFIKPTIDYFEKSGIKYSLSEKLIGIGSMNGKINIVFTNKREIKEFDKLIFALPPHSIGQIESNEELLSSEIQNMETSPIITIHIWEKIPTFKRKFVALIDSKVHWIFDNGDHLSIVISAADELSNQNSNEIFKVVSKELSDYFDDFTNSNVKHFKIIKEKRATLKCTAKNEQIRKSIVPKFANLYFAGDWTNTGLPGTIEGAILSGKLVANQIN